MIRLGILGSGSGSNMQAILNAIEEGTLDAEIVMVLSDIPDAYILKRAAQAGLPAELINCRGHRSKFPVEAQSETAELLKEAGVELVCLAGFMRLLRAPLLNAFPGRIINIHPSLLPEFVFLYLFLYFQHCITCYIPPLSLFILYFIVPPPPPHHHHNHNHI